MPRALFLGRLTQTRGAGADPVIGLFACRTPCRNLCRIQPALAAGFSQIRLIERRRFQHRCELVARRPAFGARVGVGQKLPLTTRLSTPLVQRRSEIPSSCASYRMDMVFGGIVRFSTAVLRSGE